MEYPRYTAEDIEISLAGYQLHGPEIKVSKLLGEGNFSYVEGRLLRRRRGQDAKEHDSEGVHRLKLEVNILRQLRHTNIVQFLGVAYVSVVVNGDSQMHYGIVMEKVHHGTLVNVLEVDRDMSLQTKVLIIRDIARGLCRCTTFASMMQRGVAGRTASCTGTLRKICS